jgi:hypothetical protein
MQLSTAGLSAIIFLTSFLLCLVLAFNFMRQAAKRNFHRDLD